MSGGGQQQHPQSVGTGVPMSSGPRPDPLAGLTGSSPMAGGQKQQVDPNDIKALLASLSGSQQMQAAGPGATVNGGAGIQRSAGNPDFAVAGRGLPPFLDKGQIHQDNPGITPQQIGQAVVKDGINQAATVGLGAGDAAAAAARQSAAALPGATSGEAVAGIQSQMAAAQREKIARIQKLAMQMATGGGG